MQRSSRRLIALAAAVVAFTIGAALLYQIGMAELEGKHRTFWDSIEWAAESLSTTGYGFDAHWNHPAMVMLVVFVQFVGVFLFFLIVPIFMIPFLEERFEERLPRLADHRLHDHVIVYRYGPAVETLLQRLRESGVATLVAETDEGQARAVLEHEESVVFSRSDEDILDSCRLSSARAIVANGRDEENAGVILRARQLGFRKEIYAFVEEPAHRMPMELAGATAAYTPRHIVAAALAAHASDMISPRIPGLDKLTGVRRCEIRVPDASVLAGKTLGEADIARTGAAVVGQWGRSRLETRCGSQMRIQPGSILELVGDEESLSRAAALIGSTPLRQSGPFLVAGFGEVGRKVHELLTDAGEEVRVVERSPGARVDVVGNVLDPSVLERAGIAETRAVVLALNSDDATLFATVIVRDIAPDVPVIARVNHARNLENIHRAGADYALSISDVSGEMVSSRLLGRSARRDEHRSIVRTSGARFAGKSIAELEAAGVVLAVERNRGPVRIEPGVQIESGDVLWICATGSAIRELSET
ncbi:MAG: potassium channel family protein [Thermoanaerobaculia bacterium]